MWAHYGDRNHNGVAFEIDFSKIKYLGNPENVKYPTDLANKRDDLKNDIGTFLTTYKHKVWSYENEVRLIVDTERITNQKGFKKSNDEKFLYVDFNLNFISKIIFGIKSDKKDELKILNMIKDKGLNPKFEKMRIDPVTLKLTSISYKL